MQDTVYSLFLRAAASRADRPAIKESGRTLTFRELSRMIDRLAASFPENVSRVGIVMNHRAEMIAAVFAALKRGAAYIPAEPNFPTKRIRHMMKEAGADFVLTEPEYADKLKGFPLRFIDGNEADPSEEPPAENFVAADPEAPAYVLYTSGTTGKPKGIRVLNRNVCHYVRAFQKEFHLRDGDVMLQNSVCTFDIFVEEVFAGLLNGAALAVPSAEEKKDLASLMDFVRRQGVTVVSGFPYLLAEMNRAPELPSSLRLLISGGDVLRGAYVNRLLDRAEVYNTYGPSETTVCASYYRCNGGAVCPDGTYPVGRPVDGAYIRIVDGDGKEVPDGEIGEIAIGGGGVSGGYIGDHAKESEAFERLPDGSVRYRSGDLGYRMPDGNIAFLRRKDDQIMIEGKRVETAEVESVLGRCENVSRAVVRSFTDEKGYAYMIAYIVPATEKVKVSQIRRELSENLAPFMIPEFIVKTPRIPLNENGKPDTSQLPVVLKEGISWT